MEPTRKITNDKLQQLIEILIAEVDEMEYLKEVFLSNNKMLELLFESYFEKKEGSMFCFDKTLFTIKKILQSFKEGKKLSLHEKYDLEKHPNMRIYENEEPYWCPKTFEDTDEAIGFAYSVLSLQFSNVEQLKAD